MDYDLLSSSVSEYNAIFKKISYFLIIDSSHLYDATANNDANKLLKKNR